jgi:SagB-type dehydrogenase family enzyme
MKYYGLLVLLLSTLFIIPGCGKGELLTPPVDNILLPEPKYDSDTSIEEALLTRRSVRSFNGEAVTLEQLSQLLWAAQGITGSTGGRTAPSAGALYPLTVYAVVGDVKGILQGIYKYDPVLNRLTRLKADDRRQELAQAALGQASVKQAAVDIVITGKYEVITSRYGERGIRFTHLEAGHAAQNICLQAVGLKLGAVTVGAFDDAGVQIVLGLPEDETPLYIIPVGNFSD